MVKLNRSAHWSCISAIFYLEWGDKRKVIPSVDAEAPACTCNRTFANSLHFNLISKSWGKSFPTRCHWSAFGTSQHILILKFLSFVRCVYFLWCTNALFSIHSLCTTLNIFSNSFFLSSSNHLIHLGQIAWTLLNSQFIPGGHHN